MFKTQNPAYRERIGEKFRQNHFSHYIGFELTDFEIGKAEGILKMKPDHLQQNGYAHGGLLLTLSDVIAGFAAFSILPADKHVVTAEIKISCLRPGTGNSLIARGEVIKPGRSIYFCESRIYSQHEEKEVLIATSSSSMAVVHGA